MRAIVILFCLWSINALADELPSNLLLKCEGKDFLIASGIVPKEGKFETMLRLKDGELSDTGSPWLTTKNCTLQNGIVHCSEKSVVSTKMDSGSERRELESFIVRETGEYSFFLQTWDFEGPNASRRQIANMKLRREGVCRQISKPIF